MATISDIQTAINSAYSGGDDRVTWEGELKPLLTNLTGEVHHRGVKRVANTAALSLVSGADFRFVLVTGVGVFAWEATGTVNGLSIFSAAGGGVWVIVLATGAYSKEIVELTGVASYTLDWTPERLAAYGKFPNITVWVDHGGGIWRTSNVEYQVNNPTEPTSFYFDFGGSVNAKIIIG